MKEKKQMEDHLVNERKNNEAVVNELQEALHQTNLRYEELLKRGTKDFEKEKSKNNEIMSHFKKQLEQLESQIESYRSQMNESQSQNQKLTHQITQLVQRERILKSKLEGTQDQLQQHITQHALLHKNYLNLSKEKEHMQTSERRLKELMEDNNRRNEIRIEKNIKEMEKSQRESRQHQLISQKCQEKVAQLESKLSQVEQQKNHLQLELDKEQEERRQETSKKSRQIDQLQSECEREVDHYRQENKILKDQKEKVKDALAQKEIEHRDQLQQLQNELDEVNKQRQETIHSNDENHRIRLLEEQNLLLERKIKQYESNNGSQGLNKSLHLQNELLKSNISDLHRERYDLNEKLKMMTRHQKDQDDMLAQIRPIRLSTENETLRRKLMERSKRNMSPTWRHHLEELVKPTTSNGLFGEVPDMTNNSTSPEVSTIDVPTTPNNLGITTSHSSMLQ
ncbi:hypothetical protein AKO1_009643 [Acrasis kona]|uniref:Uncharacterized protein n=1 Tax=Acrasis kona TaxID=1008807 RepID=A0AAW2ZNS4_9EUKA